MLVVQTYERTNETLAIVATARDRVLLHFFKYSTALTTVRDTHS